MEQKAKTRALLAAFGCALAYLLAGKVLAFLPAPAWDVRALSFVHHCIAAPVVEELVFRGAIQQLAQPLGRWQAAALQQTAHWTADLKRTGNTDRAAP